MYVRRDRDCIYVVRIREYYITFLVLKFLPHSEVFSDVQNHLFTRQICFRVFLPEPSGLYMK